MAPTTRLQARRYIIEHENTRKEYVTSKKFWVVSRNAQLSSLKADGRHLR
jgi:hypothetical protein